MQVIGMSILCAHIHKRTFVELFAACGCYEGTENCVHHPEEEKNNNNEQERDG